MFKVALSSIAVAAFAFAAPALAAGPDGAATNGAVPGTGKPKADQRYCVVFSVTGSIVPHKVCKTRAHWLAEGFDPLAKQ
ncbi:MAG: hypothetical protein JWM65_329 [Sphingomonas bacterium]|nr:hypothetical protein [Sphingomonas bacterium]